MSILQQLLQSNQHRIYGSLSTGTSPKKHKCMTTEEYDILHANIAHCYTKLHHSQTINAQSQCNVAYIDSCVIVMHQLQLIFFLQK